MNMTPEREERTCVRCGRLETEAPLSLRFAAGDFCGIEAYYLCAECAKEDDDSE